MTKTITVLPTCIWWKVAAQLPLRDLHSLRLVSRQVEHEVHTQYLERLFEVVELYPTSNSARSMQSHPLWASERHAAVRSLTMQSHLEFKLDRVDDCRLEITPPGGERRDPMATIGGYPNLRTLKISGVDTQWLSQRLPVDTLKAAIAARSVSLATLEVDNIVLGTEDLVQLLHAFGHDLTALSLKSLRLLDGRWVDLFRTLQAMALRRLYLEIKEDVVGPEYKPYHCLPRTSKWLSRTELYLIRSYKHGTESFQGIGRAAVQAGLQGIIEVWEAD
ncbi:hypothetical protein LTR15_010082 [Elasticomyces elasticus]|nr:hypothetical protein LTR15_010082 [Elasticomyces elasticus]